MPEIAEVETIRSQLDEMIVGDTLLSFTATHPRATRRHLDPSEIDSAISGSKITGTSRHGKYLSIHVDGHILNLHLRMSGRLLVWQADRYNPAENPKHSHVIITTNKHVIVFVDPRTFGEIWLDDMSHLKKGIDALSDIASLLEALLNYQSSRMLKTVLLDQNFVSGIGNIYADEICAEAKILPTRRFDSLSLSDKDELANSTSRVLNEAVKYRGSSLRDESFSDLYGELGQYQKFHRVHARKTCRKCEAEISKTKVAGRSTYYCSNCQI